MEHSEARHPRLRTSREEGALVVFLPVRAGKYRLVLDLIWFGVWLAAEGALVASLVGTRVLPGGTRLLLALLALFTAAGLFLAYRLLWYWGGSERMVAGADGLRASRRIFGLGRELVFPPERIRGVRARRLSNRLAYPMLGRMFVGTGNGEVILDVDGNELAYGKGLMLEDAEGLADLLRAELRGAVEPDRRPTEFRLL